LNAVRDKHKTIRKVKRGKNWTEQRAAQQLNAGHPFPRSNRRRPSVVMAFFEAVLDRNLSDGTRLLNLNMIEDAAQLHNAHSIYEVLDS
jgi:hypothetical protein